MADDLLGKRVICEGFSGEIKYVGPVPPTSGEWYGIEWDDKERGKHNGTHEGIKYFDCRHPHSGSFVRPKKVLFGISVIEALKQRYGQGGEAIDEEDMYVFGKQNSKKAVEMVGVESIQKKQSNYKKLKQVSLRELAVNGPDKETDFHTVAPDIKELDLSKNLLNSWSDVASITRGLQHLKVLNVMQNFLMLPREPDQLSSSFFSVSVAFLNRMRLSWAEVEVVIGMMPSIQELHLCHNCIQDLSGRDGVQSELRGLQNIQLLNLEGNQLSDWNVVLRLAHLPRLKCLILNDNGITAVKLGNKVQDEQRCGPLFPSLSSLSLSKNRINDIQSINELNNLPSLNELRFKDNPLFQEETTFSSRQELIARLPSLTALNSSVVSQAEREAAQRAYLKKFAKSWVNAGGSGEEGKTNNLKPAFVELHPRYEELIKVHGIPPEVEMSHQTAPKTLKDSLISVTIKCPDAPDKKSVTKKLPGTMTIGKVKGLLFRLFKVDSADQKLSCVDSKLNREIELDDDLRQLTFYSVVSGDTIYLRW